MRSAELKPSAFPFCLLENLSKPTFGPWLASAVAAFAVPGACLHDHADGFHGVLDVDKADIERRKAHPQQVWRAKVANHATLDQRSTDRVGMNLALADAADLSRAIASFSGWGAIEEYEAGIMARASIAAEGAAASLNAVLSSEGVQPVLDHYIGRLAG